MVIIINLGVVFMNNELSFHIPAGYPYSGIGPYQFNRAQLLRVLSMQASAGRKLRRPLKNYKNASKMVLINEAKRVRGSKSWADFYFSNSVQRLFGK